MTELIVPPGKKKGLLPRTSRYGDVCPLLKDEVRQIPRDQWSRLIPAQPGLRPHTYYVHDQNGIGSCASESATSGLMIVRRIAGEPDVILNPWSVYQYTQVSGGGSTLDDNLAHLREHGAAPMDLWPRSKGVRPLPEDVRREARKYRIEEYFDIDSAEEAATALLLGFAVVFGWDGHSCIFTRLLNDRGNCEYLNSWGRDWSDDGFGTLYLSQVNWSYGMFAYRTAVTSE